MGKTRDHRFSSISRTSMSMLVWFIALLQGCSGLRTRADLRTRYEGSKGSASSEQRPVVDGPVPSVVLTEESPIPQGEVIKPTIRPAVVVFGPGQARAFATLGILQGWQDAGLPIAEIYASETSALVAALYASSRTSSETEWKLLKIKSDCFLEQESVLDGLFSRKPTARCIEDAIDAAFGSQTFRDLRLPLRVGFENPNGEVVWVNSGSIASALKNSYRSVAIHGARDLSHSILEGSAFPTARIRESFSGPVVAVDFSISSARGGVRPQSASGIRGRISDETNARVRETEAAYEREMLEVSGRSLESLKDSDHVWRPFEGRLELSYLDHRRRSEAISVGRESIQQQLSVLSRLTGVNHE